MNTANKVILLGLGFSALLVFVIMVGIKETPAVQTQTPTIETVHVAEREKDQDTVEADPVTQVTDDTLIESRGQKEDMYDSRYDEVVRGNHSLRVIENADTSKYPVEMYPTLYTNKEHNFQLRLLTYPDYKETEPYGKNIGGVLFYDGVYMGNKLSYRNLVVRFYENPERLDVTDWYEKERAGDEYSYHGFDIDDSDTRTYEIFYASDVEVTEIKSVILDGNLMVRTLIPHDDTVIEIIPVDLPDWPETNLDYYREIVQSYKTI